MNLYKIRVSQTTNELIDYEDLNISEWSVTILNRHESIISKYPPMSGVESEYIKTLGKAILYFDGCPNYIWNYIVDLDNPNQSDIRKQILREEKLKKLNI